MGTEIYYFSGTGNSLTVARDIARKIDGKLISIASVVDRGNIRTDADVVGIVFPVHFSAINGIPGIVQRFVENLENANSKYIFAICTCGGFSAATIENLGKIIESRGGELVAGFTVQMPSNIEAVSVKEQQKLFDEWDNKLEFIHEFVKARNEGEFETMGLPLKIALAPIFFYYKNKTFNFFKKISESSDSDFKQLIWLSDKRFYTDDDCEGCGTCSQVCPVNNIRIIEEKPQWQHHCEICFACLNWCPNGAIHGEWISEEVRYHHSDIEVADMLKQSSFKD
ncbi:EFR1 family ferrodoxin [Methanobacterium petrolearium]|uniref:EFR1 family ferrodoxin n=1 Tax=Methanobacterium petrolearium TaxID=710190 RepID=UPI001AE68965|nr:EFR1 family ferrodoxin [Methanobacterium petrolearium]MBP1946549.1 ferredoxin/flavodoxin [Methanobacterium petrolearium]BDZ69895.1 iron-sulfur protein [Methanobacterium petrolearium]